MNISYSKSLENSHEIQGEVLTSPHILICMYVHANKGFSNVYIGYLVSTLTYLTHLVVTSLYIDG